MINNKIITKKEQSARRLILVITYTNEDLVCCEEGIETTNKIETGIFTRAVL
ncbi:hypothetical protein Curi_c19350 [Gottschalkia acidurici 9a]|uniref:Uncharacterized protein n=1 Tax=Gottschalkia acidurici (strain ATCC 7906 / DSM 604 / BCRC 14475 / CIP 104303 / KCTC 5404 / NCIMB 10678 / 9a) TaxID=1128398 RepID=K0B090_GOTA9|nr:hypothetical protein [Gottschalkia acidurici]AFS78939.1 hypothetical protein Curi_c19350 [Gottschalkia acidurici 9a]